jgi:glycosyltransferase involved in cell wall biosynthesis
MEITMRLSIIIPFLNEEENILPLHERLCALEECLPDIELEIVLVDDGSTDGSVEAIRCLPRTESSKRLVRLSRNFGGEAALSAGVAHATGDVMFFLPADLQEPPELLIPMLDKWRAGYEIVWGMRESRDDSLMTRFFARLFYMLLRRYALPQMPLGGVNLCLVDRKVVASLGNLQERNSSLSCLLMWSGFQQCFIPYRREARQAGHSKWSLGRKIKIFIDSFVAFSFLPMRLISALGGLISLLGLLYAGVIIVDQLFFTGALPGWSSLMVTVLLCSGVQMLMLGILSEYLWRALEATRNRPFYIVRETLSLESEALLERQEAAHPLPVGETAELRS